MLRLKNISDKNSISLDLICYLPATPVDRLVYCAELSINSSEFYSAGQQEIKPEYLLVVDAEEYDSETSVLYQDKRYSIYRTYPRSDGLLELYCNKKAGVYHGSS